MPKRKRKPDEVTFRSETPPTVWPPTVSSDPVAFTRTLQRHWREGVGLLIGAVILAVGFFVIHGALGIALGVIGTLMVLGSLVWGGLKER